MQLYTASLAAVVPTPCICVYVDEASFVEEVVG